MRTFRLVLVPIICLPLAALWMLDRVMTDSDDAGRGSLAEWIKSWIEA